VVDIGTYVDLQELKCKLSWAPARADLLHAKQNDAEIGNLVVEIE
jgi:hypothetical protein